MQFCVTAPFWHPEDGVRLALCPFCAVPDSLLYDIRFLPSKTTHKAVRIPGPCLVMFRLPYSNGWVPIASKNTVPIIRRCISYTQLPETLIDIQCVRLFIPQIPDRWRARWISERIRIIVVIILIVVIIPISLCVLFLFKHQDSVTGQIIQVSKTRYSFDKSIYWTPPKAIFESLDDQLTHTRHRNVWAIV